MNFSVNKKLENTKQEQLIKDINKKVFVILNRSKASEEKRWENKTTTAIITSVYAPNFSTPFWHNWLQDFSYSLLKNIWSNENLKVMTSIYAWRWFLYSKKTKEINELSKTSKLKELEKNYKIFNDFISFIKEKWWKNHKRVLSSISSIQYWMWVPNEKELDRFLEFFRDETGEIDTKLLSSITWMLSWYWICSQNELVEFLSFFRDENNNIDIKYLKSITWMQNWKWFPNISKLISFLNLLKKYNTNFKEILPSITSIQNWKWIPDLEKLEEFLQYFVEDWLLNKNHLASIASIIHWKGIVDIWEVINFEKSIKKYYKNDFQTMLSSIASMQALHWFLEEKKLDEFLSDFIDDNWIVNQQQLASTTNKLHWKGYSK